MDDIWLDNARDTIDNIKKNNNVYAGGKVAKVGEYLIEVVGLNDVMFHEEININDKASGYVLAIYPDKVIVALVNIYDTIVVGDIAYGLKRELKCFFSTNSIGKIIDIFGNDLIEDKKLTNLVGIDVKNEMISFMDREKINRELLTSIAGIDLMYPIGKGQKQLIIGPKKTGKTQLCLDTIVNQKNKNVLCIYVALGKARKEVKEIYQELMKRGATSYTIIIASFPDELPTKTYLTPYVSLSIAKSFMSQAKDVLVCLDDLRPHANSYRQISLASHKIQDKSTYPLDIFSIYSRLLEQACQHSNGGSITILPVVETINDNITDYLSTNLLNICDGQIVLSAQNFAKGIKPAIDYKLSISRLGGRVQDNKMKMIGYKARTTLLSYLDICDIYKYANYDKLSDEIKTRLTAGKRILDNLMQYKFSPRSKNGILRSFKFIDNDIIDDNNNELTNNSNANNSSSSDNTLTNSSVDTDDVFHVNDTIFENDSNNVDNNDEIFNEEDIFIN